MLFSIEGNIGAGKSTIIQHLKDHMQTVDGKDVVFIPEPVSEWETVVDITGQSMIELFYKDPSKYSFAFQMMAYISRLAIIQSTMEKNPNAIFITERCLLSDYHIFAKMLYEKNHLSLEEFTIYKKWFHYFNTIHITGFIYIKCDPKTAFDRCVSRNRQGETISFDYISECHDKHMEWFDALDASCSSILILDNDVITIDGALFEIEDFIKDELNDEFEITDWDEYPLFLTLQQGYIITMFVFIGFALLL